MVIKGVVLLFLRVYNLSFPCYKRPFVGVITLLITNSQFLFGEDSQLESNCS